MTPGAKVSEGVRASFWPQRRSARGLFPMIDRYRHDDCKSNGYRKAPRSMILHAERPRDVAANPVERSWLIVLERCSPMPPFDPYGVFGVLYSTSFCNGFQTVS